MSFCVILVTFLGQCHFYVTFMSLRCHWKSFLFGVILVSFLCQFDVILVSFKCHFSVILATFLSHFCVILETIFNVIFVRCLCRFGVVLVSFWCHFGVIQMWFGVVILPCSPIHFNWDEFKYGDVAAVTDVTDWRSTKPLPFVEVIPHGQSCELYENVNVNIHIYYSWIIFVFIRLKFYFD